MQFVVVLPAILQAFLKVLQVSRVTLQVQYIRAFCFASQHYPGNKNKKIEEPLTTIQS
jgi:hypothetical protein